MATAAVQIAPCRVPDCPNSTYGQRREHKLSQNKTAMDERILPSVSLLLFCLREIHPRRPVEQTSGHRCNGNLRFSPQKKRQESLSSTEKDFCLTCIQALRIEKRRRTINPSLPPATAPGSSTPAPIPLSSPSSAGKTARPGSTAGRSATSRVGRSQSQVRQSAACRMTAP